MPPWSSEVGVGGHDVDVPVPVQVDRLHPGVGVDLGRRPPGLPLTTGLVQPDADPGGLALNAADDVRQPVLVHIGDGERAHIPFHRQAQRRCKPAAPLAVCDRDRPRLDGTAHDVDVTVPVHVGQDDGDRLGAGGRAGGRGRARRRGKRGPALGAGEQHQRRAPQQDGGAAPAAGGVDRRVRHVRSPCPRWHRA